MTDDKKKEVDLGDYPDEESKKIAEEMAKEEAEKAKPEPEPKKEEQPEKKEEEDEEDEEKDNEDEEEGDEEEEEEAPKTKKRIPQMMPLHEHMRAKKGWQKKEEDFKKQIEELSKAKDTQTEKKTEDDVNKIAEEFGFEPTFVEKLVGIAASRVQLPEDIKQKLESLEEEKKVAFQEKEFLGDFKKNVSPLLGKEGITEKSAITKVRNLIQDLAFTEKYAGNDLDEIYFIAKQKGLIENLGLQKGKKSAESSKGGTSVSGGESGPKRIEDMTDEEFEKFSDEQGKKTSNYTYINPNE